MLRNSQRLLGLINQLLEISKLNSGKVRLQATRQNIIPILRGIIASFTLLIQRKQIDIHFNPQQEEIFLYINSGQIEQVMTNLLSNAVKNTPPNGTITVSAGTGYTQEKAGVNPKGYLKVTVTDTGRGIPAGQLPHIFDLFYQAQPYEHKDKGSGIGLALTRELVELHHGDISVQSTEGKGTEFSFRIPLGTSHLKPEEIMEEPQQSQTRTETRQPGHTHGKEQSDWENRPFTGQNADDGHIQKKLSQSAGIESANLITPVQATQNSPPLEMQGDTSIPQSIQGEGEEKPLILVVEDNTDMRRYLCSAFDTSYRVIEAKDGREGWARVSAVIPDLVISDVLMPHMDGNRLCRRIKEHTGTSHIPIILLTVRNSSESVLQGLQAGADDYIPKPFNPELLRARVRNLIQLRRQNQERIKNRMAMQPEEISISPLDEEFYDKLQQTLEKHLSEPGFNVERLAKKLSMGRTTLYRKVLALTGETPNQFIRSYRLQRAAQLFEARAGNVSEISSMVGYTNPVYFAHCYREKYFISPSEAKKESNKKCRCKGARSNGVEAVREPKNKSFDGGIHPPHIQGQIFRNETLGAEGSNPAQPKARNRELILIVEDNPDMCGYIRESLEIHYRIEVGYDGHQGLESAQKLHPDLVISDIMMSGIDGIQLSRRLKSNLATSHIPIILLTARAAEKDILNGYETGVDDYITKPFNTGILLARIRNIFRLCSQRRAKRRNQMRQEPAEITVSSMDEAFLKEVDQCIEENLSDFDFSVEVLAEKLLMGRSTLYRKILALTGEDPTHYIRSFRLNKAAQMLKRQNCSIIDVAFDVGFTSSSYFTRCFKEMFHCLPSDFCDSENN